MNPFFRLLVGGGGGPSLFIRAGVDTTLGLRLDGGYLVCTSNGGAGMHRDLAANYPDVYFSRPACWCHLGAGRPAAYSEIWELDSPLPLGFAPARITSVELVESGRSNVGVGGKASSDCRIEWSDDTVRVVDDRGSSSLYEIKINFEF